MNKNYMKRSGWHSVIQADKNIKRTHSLGGIRKKTNNCLKKPSTNTKEHMRRSLAIDDIKIHYYPSKKEILRRSLGEINDKNVHSKATEKKRSSSEPPAASVPMEETIEVEYNRRSNNPQIKELDNIFSNMNI